jgi:tetratricopeptide (TPR) repeat protein
VSNAQELQEQGVKLFRQKEYEAARKVFEQAVDAYEAEGRGDSAAEMKTNIGLIHRALGEYQPALDVMREAFATFESLNDVKRAAMVLGNMGGVYEKLGDKEQAYNCYRRAVDAFQELGEKQLLAETLKALGALQVEDGKLGAGAANYEAGLNLQDELTARQKVLKGLIGIRNRFTGGGST